MSVTSAGQPRRTHSDQFQFRDIAESFEKMKVEFELFGIKVGLWLEKHLALLCMSFACALILTLLLAQGVTEIASPASQPLRETALTKLFSVLRWALDTFKSTIPRW